MDNAASHDSARNPGRRGLRFGLRTLLAAVFLFALCLAWFTGRIGFREARPSRVAVFGDEVIVYEWELPASVQSCFLRIDGQPAGARASNESPESKNVRLAIVQNHDATTFHYQLAGVTTRTVVRELPDTTWRQSSKPRRVTDKTPTAVYIREHLDASQRIVRRIELMIE
jgi:hypothetical protein